MPRNGLGMCCRTGAYDFESVRRQILHYLYLGGRLIDTADLYLNHVPIGVALQEIFKGINSFKLSREDVFITTKVFPRHFGRETVKKRVRYMVRGTEDKESLPTNVIQKTVESNSDSDSAVTDKLAKFHHTANSTNSLHLQYANLVLMHMPVNFQAAIGGHPNMPQFARDFIFNMGRSQECIDNKWDNSECRKQTWIGLAELVQEGVIKDAGVSNFNIKHIKEIESLYDQNLDKSDSIRIVKIANNQIKWNPWAPTWTQDIFQYCEKRKISITAYGSLGMTMEKKKAESQLTIQNLQRDLSLSPQSILLRWAVQYSNNTAIIPGTSKTKHMKSNLDVWNWKLSENQMQAINSLSSSPEAADFSYDQWPEWV